VIESPKFDELKSPDSEEFISPKFARQLASLQSKLKRKRARKIVESDSESDYDQKQRSKPLSKPSADGPLIKREKAETRSKELLNYEIVEVSGDDDHGRDDGPRTEKRAIQVMDADQMRRWMAQMREDPEASKSPVRPPTGAQRRKQHADGERSALPKSLEERRVKHEGHEEDTPRKSGTQFSDEELYARPPRLRRKVAAPSKAESIGSRPSTARASSIASTRMSVKKDLEDLIETAKRTARRF
jgi:hypothetical protein